MKGEEGLVNMKKLIKEVKVSKVTKANLKQYLQQINSYVNKLKQSNSATTPVKCIKNSFMYIVILQ